MAQRHLGKAVWVVALTAVMVGSLSPISKVAAQGTKDVFARKKVEQFLQKDSGSAAKASIQFVDLNGDGTAEALVISGDSQDCGSHGCAAFVLDLRGPAAKDIGDFIAFDLQPLSSRTRGWRDISVIGSRNKNRVSFNGRVYSSAEDSSAAAPPSGPPPEGPCLTTTGNANTSNLVAECKGVSGVNKHCSPNVSCTDIMRQIVSGCEAARKTGRNYKQFCVDYPANLGLPDD
jgi:hypothetical protein